MEQSSPPIPVLTIGGSDSGGAAGVQADLKTFTALRVYGMSALTAVTAQNSVRVAAVHYLQADFLAAQIDAVFEDYGAAAIKTGFVGPTELIQTVAERLRIWQAGKPSGAGPLVVDPVLVNHRGEAMFGREVVEAYCQLLMPIATLITPNLAEAALLTGQPVEDLAGAGTAAEALVRLGARNVLLKGIRAERQIVDLYYDGVQPHPLPVPYLETGNTHGSGDTLSAAIVAGLARGLPLLEAIRQAQTYTRAALRGSRGWRLGAGHGPLQHWATPDDDASTVGSS
jgi:hydroxymethylpyrimidine/phosphomethylpyrimidine kinase